MFRVLFVDHAHPEDWVAAAFEARPDVVVGFARDADEALRQVKKCDMVFVSATLAEDDPVEVVRAVAAAEPNAKILVKDLAEAHQAATAYVEAGAAGWML